MAQCSIGQKLSMIEMKIAIALMVHRYDLELVPGQAFEPINTITYGLKNGLSIKISGRK